MPSIGQDEVDIVVILGYSVRPCQRQVRRGRKKGVEREGGRRENWGRRGGRSSRDRREWRGKKRGGKDREVEKRNSLPTREYLACFWL